MSFYIYETERKEIGDIVFMKILRKLRTVKSRSEHVDQEKGP